MRYKSGRAYLSGGTVLDATSASVVGTFTVPQGGLHAVSPTSARVYFLNSASGGPILRIFNSDTFAQIAAFQFTNAAGTVGSLITWGENRVAFRTSSGQIYFVTIAGDGPATPATMTSPANGSTLSGASQNFTWTDGTGATGYAIYAGSSVGGYEYFSSLYASTSGTVTGLPTNGATVYIRLWTNLGGTWQSNDYTYTAASGGGGGAATMTTPAPGSTLSGASQQFNWTTAQGATQYGIYAGSSPGAYNYFSGLFGGTSGTVTGLPANGSTVFIRLWTSFNGVWQFVDYTYTAANGGGGGGPSTMTSPAPGSVLAGASQLFNWTTVQAATGYAIYAGSSAGAANYFASLFNGTSGTATGLPTNGSTVWIRLWTNFNGAWQFIDYQYTAANGGGGGPATMTAPVPGTTLAGASQLFNWTAAQGATGYAIYAGTSAGASNYFASLFNGTSGTATGLPTNGSPLWIRLWTNFNGAWQFIDYPYISANGGGGTPATMTSPAPGSDIGGVVNFSWTTAAGTTGYALYVGTLGPGTFNIYGALVGGTAQSVPNVPAGTIYVRLWTNFAGGWQFVDYVYQ
jgi:hypothetical protein